MRLRQEWGAQEEPALPQVPLNRTKDLTEPPAGGEPVSRAKPIAKLSRLLTLQFPDPAFWETQRSAWGLIRVPAESVTAQGSHVEILELC